MELNTATNNPMYLIDQWRNKPWFLTVVGILVALLAGWLIGAWGTMGVLITIGLPIVLALGAGILIEPRFGLFIYVQLSFMISMGDFLKQTWPWEQPSMPSWY